MSMRKTWIALGSSKAHAVAVYLARSDYDQAKRRFSQRISVGADRLCRGLRSGGAE